MRLLGYLSAGLLQHLSSAACLSAMAFSSGEGLPFGRRLRGLVRLMITPGRLQGLPAVGLNSPFSGVGAGVMAAGVPFTTDRQNLRCIFFPEWENSPDDRHEQQYGPGSHQNDPEARFLGIETAAGNPAWTGPPARPLSRLHPASKRAGAVRERAVAPALRRRASVLPLAWSLDSGLGSGFDLPSAPAISLSRVPPTLLSNACQFRFQRRRRR